MRSPYGRFPRPHLHLHPNQTTWEQITSKAGRLILLSAGGKPAKTNQLISQFTNFLNRENAKWYFQSVSIVNED